MVDLRCHISSHTMIATYVYKTGGTLDYPNNPCIYLVFFLLLNTNGLNENGKRKIVRQIYTTRVKLSV